MSIPGFFPPQPFHVSQMMGSEQENHLRVDQARFFGSGLAIKKHALRQGSVREAFAAAKRKSKMLWNTNIH